MRHCIFLYILIILSATACRDDLLEGEDDFIPEGTSRLTAVVNFKPLTPALNGMSRTAGNAVKSIKSLTVLLYDRDGNLVESYPITEYTVEGEEDRNDADAEDEKTAESKTPHVEFNMLIPYGRYFMYAVANMGDLEGLDISTVEKLKSISLTWQDNIADNNQMFGHFTVSEKEGAKDEALVINQKNMTLHAWIRRVVSKITVAYDGSKLEEGVFIYIKSVQIKDIPSTCLLGDENTITEPEKLIHDGEKIEYCSKDTPYDEFYPARITKGRPYYPCKFDGEKNSWSMDTDVHSEDAENTLFFYENMQGTGEDKRQDATGGSDGGPDGILDHPGLPEDETYFWKDGKECGTYIEVQAYYRSRHPERVGNGNIVYRFMLGKNVTTDYNAERNYHYKLTLKFNRFANDVDWHIEYKEDVPSIQVPEPFYISYLYNHEAAMPVKVNVSEGYELEKFEAQIDTNGWAPYKASDLDYYREMDPEVTEGAPLNPWNGFLSLRKTKTKVIPFTGADVTLANDVNKKYYEDHRRGTRVYFENRNLNSSDNNETDGKYDVVKNDDNTYTFSLPIYTRAKQLIIPTGYTGNNPYVAYRRRASVKFIATLKSKDGGETKTVTQNASILQVRRVVNPKGVWRRAGNNKDFHVVLKHLPKESAEEFIPFTSEGEWRAYVVRGDRDFVTLNGKDEVHGSTGSYIDFTIGFKGETPKDGSRCAIVRVEYHNYSCVHLIFVRQGQAPMALVEGGSEWLTCNMRTKDQEASCPLEEGSMFRFGDWDNPIDATNNVEVGVSNRIYPLKIAENEDKILWDDIPSSDYNGSFSSTRLKDGREVAVASYEDYNELWGNDEVLGQGFGVLYGDDARETLSKVDEVYGHRYDKHGDASEPGAGFGMRGVFVYNMSETSYGGRNLFFPIGATGHGRRKNQEDASWKKAVLRYAGRSAPIAPGENLSHRPIFYDIYIRPGAIYWLDRRKDDGRVEECIAWDFNYFSFDYNGISANNVFTTGQKEVPNSSDACFIRCVVKK